ncbi:hypothetical protein CP533_3592 [Ophiocordyceps camponoti-saundersi (nom. inval.)]|nr:hypothetical protein CP533_3592 [Ophiocordyceps camponoti-saundersi (nom. inval.)]
MAPEKQPFYHPLPPSYDQALASGSRGHGASSPPSEDEEEDDVESRLLAGSTAARHSTDRLRGYRPPTVETDDEDSVLGFRINLDDDDDDDDDDDAITVRNEMEQMEIEEQPPPPRGSSWPKMLPSFSLPRWNWPKMRRLRAVVAIAVDNYSALHFGSRPTLNEDDKDRLCKFGILFMICIFLVSIGIIYFSSSVDVRYARFSPEDLRQHIITNVEPMRLRASVLHYSNYAHVAGTEGDYATALDMETMFNRAGLEAIEVDEYNVYVNYPRKDGRDIQIIDDANPWSARLDEDEMGGETAGRQTYAFHGLSRSGDVRGPLMYANYGSRDDFAHLQARGIDTRGAVALVRRHRGSSVAALQVKAAELAGFAGCIIYTDPADDGFERGDVAPRGRWMPTDGVRRDSVGLTGWVAGDVLTPGWESKKGEPRLKVGDAAGLVGIPSLPLAWRDAHELLRRLQGHGERVPAGWLGGVPDLGDGGWWTGNRTSPVVRIRNEQDEIEDKRIWNVYGRIIGQEQAQRSVLLGNHRDAWAFGASDPHAGTAVMIELARIFGGLVERGWRPLRTIEFMSWDGATYNLMGSTEFVEKSAERLRDEAYAYINLDAAVAGTRLRAAGSPALQRPLERALEHIFDQRANATLSALWNTSWGGQRLAGLGAGGDYAALQHMAGTSSLDLAFVDGADDKGISAAHSSFDRLALVEDVVDPGFSNHVLLAQLVGVLLLDLADRPVVPLGMAAYGKGLKEGVVDLKSWLKTKQRRGESSRAIPQTRKEDDEHEQRRPDAAKAREQLRALQELTDAADMADRNARVFDGWEREWDRLMLTTEGREAVELRNRRFRYNDRKAAFETALLDLELGGGIPNRTQFKHVVYGPQLWSTRDVAVFPAIRDSIDAGDWKLANRVILKTAAILRRAAAMLTMEDDEERVG